MANGYGPLTESSVSDSNDKRILVVLGLPFPSNTAASARVSSLVARLTEEGYHISIAQSIHSIGTAHGTGSSSARGWRVLEIIPRLPFAHVLANSLNVALSFLTSLAMLFTPFDLAILSVPPYDSALGFHLGLLLRQVVRDDRTKFAYDYRDDVLDESLHKQTMRGIYRIDRYLLSLLLRIMSIVLRRSDIIICTTVEHRQSLIQRGFDPGKIRVVPNGADTRLFTKGNEAEKDLMRLKYGLPKDSFVLVVMTDAGWQKYRLEPMVIALQKVHQIPNLRNYVLLVVGRWTRELRAYLKLAERTGITVCYVGEIAHDKMPEVLHAADVGLIPLADFEDARHILPVKLFEYCSCKLPVLVTAPSDSLLGRVVSEHSLGLVCQPQDTEAIAEALQRFCTNDKLREEMGKHCRSVIEEEYDRQLLSKRYKTILEGLLARKDRESLGYLPHA